MELGSEQTWWQVVSGEWSAVSGKSRVARSDAVWSWGPSMHLLAHVVMERGVELLELPQHDAREVLVALQRRAQRQRPPLARLPLLRTAVAFHQRHALLLDHRGLAPGARARAQPAQVPGMHACKHAPLQRHGRHGRGA
eukprot:scaffold54293_cov42-Phaeocystis_antarctica.AAC.1